MFEQTDDGSIIDESGKVIFFSADRFVKDICLGGVLLHLWRPAAIKGI